MAFVSVLNAQELQVKITINSQQVEGTDKSVFENLQQTLQQWMDDRQWTELQFQKNERIVCNFNITVTKYDKSNNRFFCNAMIQANRPVYNSAYTTTLYNNKDADFNFDFVQFDQLNFIEEVVDNQLTALMAYYAYLIIGLDLDSFSPLGGTDVLQRCMQLTNNAQDLGFAGWKERIQIQPNNQIGIICHQCRQLVVNGFFDKVQLVELYEVKVEVGILIIIQGSRICRVVNRAVRLNHGVAEETVV